MNMSNGTQGQPQGQNGQNVVRPNMNQNMNQQSPNLNKQQPQGQQQAQQQWQGQQPQGTYGQQQQQNYNQYQQQQPYGQNAYQQQNTYQQQNAYQQMNYGYQPVRPNKTTLGLVGLILSAVSFICCGPLLAIPGIICCIIAFSRNKQEKRALIGIILAVISIIIWVILTVNVGMKDGRFSITHTDKDGNVITDIEKDARDDNDDGSETTDNEPDSSSSLDDITEDSTDSTDSADELAGDDWTIDEADETSVNPVYDTPIGTDTAEGFDPSQVIYNGNTLKMGMSPDEVQQLLGYEFKESDLDVDIDPDHYDFVAHYVYDELEYVIYFYFINDTNETKKVRDCTLYRVGFEANNMINDSKLSDFAQIDLGSGLTDTATKEIVKVFFGEPDYIYENDEYDKEEYSYYKQWDHEYRVIFGFYGEDLCSIEIGRY